MYIFIALIVATFLIFSYKLRNNPYIGNSYMFADLIWRCSIVVMILFLAPESLKIAVHEVIFVAVFLSCTYIITYWLSKYYKLSNSWYFIAVSVVGAPIMEEILFRGYVMEIINESAINKIMFSSILFGAYHLKNYFIKSKKSLIIQILYATLLIGPLFGWVYLSTSSLLLPILLHAVNNSIAMTISQKYFGKMIDGSS